MLQTKLNIKLYRKLTTHNMVMSLLNDSKLSKSLVKVQLDELTKLSNKTTAYNRHEREFICRVYAEVKMLVVKAKVVNRNVEVEVTKISDISFLQINQ